MIVISAIVAAIKQFIAKEEKTLETALQHFHSAINHLEDVALSKEAEAAHAMNEANNYLGQAYSAMADSQAAKRIGARIADLTDPEPTEQETAGAMSEALAAAQTGCGNPACTLCADKVSEQPAAPAAADPNASKPADGAAPAAA